MNFLEIDSKRVTSCGSEELKKLHSDLHNISGRFEVKKNTADRMCTQLLTWHMLLVKEMSNRKIEHDNTVSLLKQFIGEEWVAPTIEEVRGFGYEVALKMTQEQLEEIHSDLHWVFWDADMTVKLEIIELHDIASKEMINRGLVHEPYSVLVMPENMTKDSQKGKTKEGMKKTVKCNIFKVDKKRHIVYGVVMEPDTVDTDNQFQNVEEVAKAFYKFQEKAVKHYDIQHNHEYTIDDEIIVVEKYLSPVDFTVEESGEEIKKGTWVEGWKILSEPLWKAVEDGKLTGFSIEGYGFIKK